jgi:hypothetical protein
MKMLANNRDRGRHWGEELKLIWNLTVRWLSNKGCQQQWDD